MSQSSNPPTTRKITKDNLNTGKVVLYATDMVNYYNGSLTKLCLTKEDGTSLESYYGYGLQKLIESARRYKDRDWLLAERHLMPKKQN